jgi:hypothetical protein
MRRTRLTGLSVMIAVATLSLTSCSDDAGPGPPPVAAGQRFEMPLGHCWIEPVTVDGERWGIDKADQFGWGDVLGKWTGTGVIRHLSDDHLVYLDDQGRRLDLRPLADPRAFDPEQDGWLCD